MEINFFKFKDKEPKLEFEESYVEDEQERGVSVYVSPRILVRHQGQLFIGRFRKKLSNYDNRVEEIYIDIEVPEEKADWLTKESYFTPLGETEWAETHFS